MRPDSEQLRMLAQIGFIAAGRAQVEQAEVIFHAIELERPTGSAAYFGLALVYLTAGRAPDALRVLDRGLAVEGQAEPGELHAMRGLTLKLLGRAAESSGALRQAGDQPLARSLLGVT